MDAVGHTMLNDWDDKNDDVWALGSGLSNLTTLVMVEVPAVGKAGNYLDWIARGLEMNVVKRFWLNPCPIKTGARLFVL